jgi:uncharacterized protein (TIGR01777 family)
MNVLITGGSGLIGQALKKELETRKHRVAILSRQAKPEDQSVFYWDIDKQEIDDEALAFADVIIHLAGESIASRRWSKKQKKKIMESRKASTELLLDAIKRAPKKPEHLISASAIGYYGAITSDHIYAESDACGTDFLAQTVESWEASVNKIADSGLRVQKLRIGIVLSKDGGALPKLMKITKLGLASALGSGKQYMPWIALEDLVGSFVFLLENKTVKDVYNAVSTEHITNKAFMKQLAHTMNRAFFLPNVPAFLLKLLLGEMSAILLYGSRISSEALKKEGYKFRYTSFASFTEKMKT